MSAPDSMTPPPPVAAASLREAVVAAFERKPGWRMELTRLVEVLSSMHEPILPCGARLVIASEVRPEVIHG